MTADFTKLDQLTPEEAWRDPGMLLLAVREACPEPSDLNETGKEYGTGFGEKITEKLIEIVKCALKYPLEQYIEWEELLKGEDEKNNPEPLLEMNNASEEDELEYDPTEDADNPGLLPSEIDTKIHQAMIPHEVVAACRHLLCRKQPLLGMMHIWEQATEEKMDMPFLPVSEYDGSTDPETENMPERLKSYFDLVREDGHDVPSVHSMLIYSPDFLSYVKRSKIFAQTNEPHKFSSKPRP